MTIRTLIDLLYSQHREIDDQLSHVLSASRTGDWRDSDECWETLSRTLREHMTFEEDFLFPAYERSSPTARQDVVTLVLEHQELRRILERLGYDIQMHHALPVRLEEFLASLRRHKNREDALFHPWLETAELEENVLGRAREWVARLNKKAA